MNNQYNPQQPAPQQSVPQYTTPQQTAAPQQNVLQQGFSQQTAPQQAVLQSGAPQQPVSQQNVLQQAMSQQPAPQQQAIPQQPIQQQTIPQQNQQGIPQQPQYQQQYGQPYMQQPVYTRPPKPNVNTAAANKQKRDALNAFGDKLTDLMNTNPVLKTIAAHADLFSFAATALCVLFTIIALLTSNEGYFNRSINLGGEIGGCFIFPILAVIFGGFSLCKKKVLPLTVSMTAVSVLMFVRFIINIVSFATFSSVPVGNVINFIFMILEMGGVGYLTYICWTYLLAALPPKSVMQQMYQQSYASPQDNTQQAAYQQPATSQQPQTAPSPAPVTAAAAVSVHAAPQQSSAVKPETADANRICPNCQTVNGSDSLFCQKCGTKLV